MKKKKKSSTTRGFKITGKGIRHSGLDHANMRANQKIRDGEKVNE